MCNYERLVKSGLICKQTVSDRCIVSCRHWLQLSVTCCIQVLVKIGIRAIGSFVYICWSATISSCQCKNISYNRTFTQYEQVCLQNVVFIKIAWMYTQNKSVPRYIVFARTIFLRDKTFQEKLGYDIFALTQRFIGLL